jgi:hypothetical protein
MRRQRIFWIKDERRFRMFLVALMRLVVILIMACAVILLMYNR